MPAEDLRLLIAGHLHLDGVLRGIPEDEAVHSIVRDANMRAFERLVELAMEHSVDAVIITGSLFEGVPSVRAASLFRDGMAALAEEQIATVLASQSSQQINLLADCECLPESVQILSNDHPSLQIETRHAPRNPFHACLMDRVSSRSAQLPQVDLGIVNSGWLEPQHEENSHRNMACRLRVFNGAETFHAAQKPEGLWLAPGSIQALNGSYPGDRSVTICHLSATGEISYTTHSTSSVCFVEVEFPLNPAEDATRLQRGLFDRIEQSIPSTGQPAELYCFQWKMRGPIAALKTWNRAALKSILDRFHFTQETETQICHQLQWTLQLSGQEASSSQIDVSEDVEEDLLRCLTEVGMTESRQSPTSAISALLNGKTGWDQAAIEELKQQIDWKQVCHRAAELGITAWLNADTPAA